MKKIKFTKHAIRRATERKLLPYLVKEKFYYEAEYLDNHRAKVDDVIYAFTETDKEIRIKTIYKDLPITHTIL